MKRVMIILIAVLFFLGMLAGCKEKSEVEEVGELLGKLEKAEKAGNEKQAQTINKKIDELTERQTKREEESVREVEAKIGKPLRWWRSYQALAEEIPQFSVTFEQVFVSKTVPWNEMLRGQGGKKYVIAYARVENVGSREHHPSYPQAEVKIDNGSVYKTYASLFGRIGRPISNPLEMPDEWQPILVRPLRAGEKAWWAFFSEIPEEVTPVELFGELGRDDHRLKFRLKITQ